MLHGVAQAFLGRSGQPWEELEARYRRDSLDQVRAHLGQEQLDRAYARGMALSPAEVRDLASGRPPRLIFPRDISARYGAAWRGRAGPPTVNQIGGSFARLPLAPTTFCYLCLSATTAMELLRVAAWWLGGQSREGPPSTSCRHPYSRSRRTSSHVGKAPGSALNPTRDSSIPAPLYDLASRSKAPDASRLTIRNTPCTCT